MPNIDSEYSVPDSSVTSVAPARVTIATALQARVTSSSPDTRQLPRYMPDHQNTSTVTGANVVARSSTECRTEATLQWSVFSPTTRYAAATARMVSTYTTNMPRLTAGIL